MDRFFLPSKISESSAKINVYHPSKKTTFMLWLDFCNKRPSGNVSVWKSPEQIELISVSLRTLLTEDYMTMF